MKSVLISVRPKWVGKIATGEKTIEVRKTAPKCEVPFKCYIYCTKAKSQWRLSDYEGAYENSKGEIVYAQQRIIGEFICRGIMQPFDSLRLMAKESCLTEEELVTYSNGKPLYGWRISDLKIYDKPKELSEFKTGCKGCKERDTYHCKFYCYGERAITRPPQSWQYVEEL